MKKQFCRFALSTVVATGLALCGAHTFAQQDDSAQPSDQGQSATHHRHGMDPDQALARMTERYNLSTDQQSQIKPILVDQQQQMQALHQDSSLSRDDRMAKMKTIRDGSKSKIEALLNDQQKQKYEQDQQAMEQRMHDRNGPGGSAGYPPPQ